MSRRRGVLAALAAAMIVVALVALRYGAPDFSWREMASSTASLLSGRTGATLACSSAPASAWAAR